MFNDTRSSEDYPFRDSRAARLLADALARAASDRRLSQRDIAHTLGYRTSTVLSHMANGRAPIPPDRALDIAQATGMPEMPFVIAVLEQRYPSLAGLLQGRAAGSCASSDQDLAAELTFLAGRDLDELPADHKRVLREAVADPKASARWLTVHELPTVALLRELVPTFSRDGLSRETRERFRDVLS